MRNTNLNGCLTNLAPDDLTAIFLGNYAGQGTPVVKINGQDYVVPVSLYGSDYFSPVRFNIVTNPSTNKRSLKILWYADGILREAYLDVTSLK